MKSLFTTIVLAVITLSAVLSANAQNIIQESSSVVSNLTTAEVPLTIANNPGFLNLVVGENYEHKVKLINTGNNKINWVFDGNVPQCFSIEQDGTIRCKPTENNILLRHINLVDEYEIKFTASNANNPAEKVSDSFKVKFYRTEPEMPVINIVQNHYTVHEGTALKIRVDCINPTSPITLSNTTPPPNGVIKKDISKCGEEFEWIPDFSFVSEGEGGKKDFTLKFVATNQLRQRTEREVLVTVINTVDCEGVTTEYNALVTSINNFRNTVISTFIERNEEIKKAKAKKQKFDYAAITLGAAGGTLALLPNDAQHKGAAVLSISSSLTLGLKQTIGENEQIEMEKDAKLLLTANKILENALIDYQFTNCKDGNTEQNIVKLRETFKGARGDLNHIALVSINPIEIETYLKKHDKSINRKFGTTYTPTLNSPNQ
ncbi:hypothetical protein K3G39_20370 [Pontibacter sp. HSC-14F20]|uniref:hypothetical protein n=1 Tax=Pontibacter sp. HSC-14F20 TaxID=2864136 RepID=UPI001C73D96F|nr:hypothetical protein [Pontibacter sp. HSC-14F20]MBX0335594.1 hypothetical protein [Pontibacter sp. HSC-14F20]